jgi:hypothetical protein
MAYTPHTWENAPATATAISAQRLLEMEAGISSAHVIPVRPLSVNGTLIAGDANGAVEMNSATKRTFTFPAKSVHGVPVGSFVTVVNIGTAVLGIVDNTTGTPVEIMVLNQGQYLRWFQSSTDIWSASV